MDKLVLLLLLLLGVFPFMFFQDPATLCMVCHNFKQGHCLRGKGNCTMKQGPGCRTRDFFVFNEKDGWKHNYTELDCSEYCSPMSFHYGGMKISIFCCKGQEFCNRYQGKLIKYNLT
uniref:UPAR/Ly6 domain-containing protein n=1 Tax=Myotis lucifugus TaxID=59463 RepID=G1PWY8_MYOLU